MAKVEDCPGFETFGADVKAARKAKHLTRKVLAEIVGIEWRYLANIENKGTIPSLPVVIQLIKVCGLPVEQYFNPEHTTLDTGFADTAAFRWLCENAEQYGFILRYPKEAEAVTEITYEPWHWRYVGPENAALISQSGLCFEDAIAVLQKLAAGQSVTG